MRLFASLVVLACVGCAASTPKAVVAFETPRQEPKSETNVAKAEPAPKHDDAWHGHIPIGFWDTGICLGNSRDWNGVRLNWSDAGLGTINGVNVTLWKPDEDVGGTVNGVGLGLIGNGADRLNGAFASLILNAAGKDMTGVHLAGIVNAAGGSMTGIGGALIVNGVGSSMTGVHVGGIVNGAGGSITGVNVGGIVSGAGLSSTGVTAALIVAGAGQDATGLTLGGIVSGAGRDITGINLALGKVKAGRSLRGITLGGAFVESGGHNEKIDAALDQLQTDIAATVARGDEVGTADLKAKFDEAAKAEGDGDPGSISGIALTAFRARAGSMTGLIAALGNMTTDEFTGLGISLCNHVDKTQSGVTFGAFNHAEKIDGFGFQLGLLNHIPTNPTWARWLPLVNWQM